MKFSPSFQRPRLPCGGAGVVAATAEAIGLVALTTASIFSPSRAAGSACVAGAAAGGASTAAADSGAVTLKGSVTGRLVLSVDLDAADGQAATLAPASALTMSLAGSNADLAQACGSLSAGQSTDFSSAGQSAFNEADLAWQTAFFHDELHGLIHLMGKPANADDQWKHEYYTVATNKWTVVGTSMWDNPGHIYGNFTMDPLTGDVFQQRSTGDPVRATQPDYLWGVLGPISGGGSRKSNRDTRWCFIITGARSCSSRRAMVRRASSSGRRSAIHTRRRGRPRLT